MTRRALTPAQKAELERIWNGPHPGGPVAATAYHDTATGRSLVRRGLIHRYEIVAPFGGHGAMASMSVTWHCCELTREGYAEIARMADEEGEA